MILFLFCVIILPFVMGLMFMKIKKETASVSESYLCGLLFLFLLGEAASCIAIKLESSFPFYCRLLGGAVIACALVSVLLGRKVLLSFWQQRRKPDKRNLSVMQLGLLAVLSLPIIGIFLYGPYAGADTMAETVRVTVGTDTVFAYNPVMGTPLRYGMYPKYKLASLPLLYSVLHRFGGMELAALLHRAIPIVILAIAYMVVCLWGKLLFGEQKEKKRIFMILWAVLLIVGDGTKGSFAYGLLHEGWRGATIVTAVLLPFGAYLICNAVWKKEWFYGTVGLLGTLAGVLFVYPLFLPEGLSADAPLPGRDWWLLMLSVLILYLVREKIKKNWKMREKVCLGICLLLGIIPGNCFALLGCAYVCTCIWEIAEDRKHGRAALAGMIITVCLSGTVLPYRSQAVKIWDVPENEIEIQQRITEIAEMREGDVRLLAPDAVMEQALLRNERVILPYGKNLWHENCNREIADVYSDAELLLYELMKTDYLQPDTVAAVASEMNCHILVMREKMSDEAGLRYGWKEMEPVTGYAVYCK